MKVRLDNVRLAFPSLWQASSMKQADGTMSAARFSATFLMPPTHPSVAKIKAAMVEEATKKWQDKAPAMLKALKEEARLCLRSGDSKPEYDGFPGMLFLRASNKVRPLILNANKEHLTEQEGVIYGGCYVNAQIDVWVQANNWGKRINATLKGVQYFGPGDAFGAGPVASEDDFEDLGSAAPEAGGQAVDDFDL